MTAINAHNPTPILAQHLRAGDTIVETLGNRWMDWKPADIGSQSEPFPAIVCRSETRTTFYRPDETVYIWPRSQRVSFYA